MDFMRKTEKILLLLILLFSDSHWVGTDSVMFKEREKCKDDFVKEVGSDPAKEYDLIKRTCSQEFPKFQECLSEHIIDCTLDEMEIYGGYTNVYEHMCTEGMADALLHSDCLSRPAINESVNNCESTLNSKLNFNQVASKSEKCGYIEKYFKCTKDATLEICGTIAAEYHDKILRLSVDPLIENIRCGCSSVIAIMSLVAVGLLLQWLT